MLTRDLPQLAPRVPERRPVSRWVVAVMGGSDRKGRWRVSERVNAVAVMGGSSLDLRNAEVTGDEVTIVAVAVMGGIDVYVPDSVEVQVDDAAVMGGNDQRGSGRPARPGAPVVRVKAYSLMGGVVVWPLPAEAGRACRCGRRSERQRRWSANGRRLRSLGVVPQWIR